MERELFAELLLKLVNDRKSPLYGKFEPHQDRWIEHLSKNPDILEEWAETELNKKIRELDNELNGFISAHWKKTKQINETETNK